MKQGRCEVVVTRGGARAMLDHETGEVMHPIVGPLVEAVRLYVGPAKLAARLADTSRTREPLVLFDVGLGAGSNAIAAWQVSEALDVTARPLEIVSFERNLAPLSLALQPENAAAFGLEGRAGEAGRSLLQTGRHATSRTSWRVVVGDLPSALDGESHESADVIFWDPFSPRANPSLWRTGAFAALRRVCRPRAVVYTYSGATATRSALLLAGFAVGFGEVTGENKRATVGALAAADLAEPLDARWLARLGRSSAGLPDDAPAGALERIASLPQFKAT